MAQKPYIDASLIDVDCVYYLTVYRSPVVEKTDPLYQPVIEVLGSACFTVEFEHVVEDPEFLFGEAVWMLAVVHQECPGESTPHACTTDRRERAAFRAA